MPQRNRAGAQALQSDELTVRSLAARAEELRARRDRLMQLQIDTDEEAGDIRDVEEPQPESNVAELVALARLEAQHARQKARTAARFGWIAIGCMSVTVAGGAWASIQVFHKLNRDAVEIERSTAQA